VKVPLLCKDIVVDEYQVWQARAAGADAVLLVAEALGEAELARLVDLVFDLGMEPVVEAHDPTAFGRAVRTRARVVGANARDLRDPSVIDRSRARLLHTFVRPGQLFVAESGIASAADLAELPARVDAILVGTALMKAAHPAVLVRELAQAKRPAATAR
jgi:indole-3-glycerol phosphate synthase